jgi:hypothetical protein
MKIIVVLIMLILNSCMKTNGKAGVPSGIDSIGNQGIIEGNKTVNNNQLNTDNEKNTVFLEKFYPIEKNNQKSFGFQLYSKAITRHGIVFLANGTVYDYDPESHDYLGMYKTETPIRNFPFDCYIVNNSIVEGGSYYYDDDTIKPNAAVSVYSGENGFLSVYYRTGQSPQYYYIIKSDDLISWERTEIEHFGPIVLFGRENKIYAIVGYNILDVTDPDNIALYKRMPHSIFLPDGEIFDAHMTSDQSVIPIYEMDNYVFARIVRVFEAYTCHYYVIIDTNDFTFNLYDISTLQDDGFHYTEKVVKDETGWKLYRFTEDKTIVIDPFLNDGPGIINILPPVEGVR